MRNFALKQLTVLKWDLQTLLSALKENPKVTKLKIGGCSIEDEDLKQLASFFLQEKTSLETLDLSNNRFTHEGLKDLVNALVKQKDLTHLYLHWNQIGHDHALPLFEKLLKENKKLKMLGLNEISYWNDKGESSIPTQTFFTGLLEALKQNYRCRVIYKTNDKRFQKLNERNESEIAFLQNPFYQENFFDLIHFNLKEFLEKHQQIDKPEQLLSNLIDDFTSIIELDKQEGPVKEFIYSWIVFLLQESQMDFLSNSLTFHMKRALSGLSNPPSYEVKLGFHNMTLPDQLNIFLKSKPNFENNLIENKSLLQNKGNQLRS